MEGLSSDMTLLQFLRTECGLTGTKEGCASGDCGACTVVVGKEVKGGIDFYTVNSCISPVGSFQNQYVVTVEGLADEALKGAMHPVQEAMVECDGSQCGFCTPGFVMSLAGLHLKYGRKGGKAPTREAVLDAISGNLCRCTGYRPIVEAGIRSVIKPVQSDRIAQKQGSAAPFSGNLVLASSSGGYWQPESESELQSLLKNHPEARLIAGGTDLMLESTQLFQPLPEIVDLNRISSMRQIVMECESVEVGAAVTYTELEAAFEAHDPELLAMLSRLGSRQIRNRGTVGGNIGNASPIADMPPFLLVLDAVLVITASHGQERLEKLVDFYVGYRETTLRSGEYIARIRFNRVKPEQSLRLYKLSKRYEDDISSVMGAFLWDPDTGMKIAYGGMAAVPARAVRTEAEINRRDWEGDGYVDDQALESVSAALRDEFTPISDVRASAEYRHEMACNLLRKACLHFAAVKAGTDSDEELFCHG